VSLDEWQAAQPVRPYYRYDAEGKRYIVNEADYRAYEAQLTADRGEPVLSTVEPGVRLPGTNIASRRAAVADAMGVDVDDPAMREVQFGLPTGAIELVSGHSVELRAMRPAPPRSGTPPVDREASRVAGEERLSNPSEKAATLWAAEHDLPKHNKKRPSQTYEGRRKRYLRQKADRLGTTIKSVEQTTRRNGPRQPKEQPK
jgi:hypothetical protein